MNWDKHKKVFVHVLILSLLSLFLFFWRIGEMDLAGTEPYRALPARTMLETHDWSVPKLNGNPYLAKPPLTYWLISIFSMPRGEVTEASARMPSAVSAALLVLLIYWFARSEAGEEAGFLSGLIALTTGLFFEKAIAAEIEMNFTLWTAASIFFFYKALEQEDASFAKIMGAYMFLALALLSKGPPALIFFFAAVVSFLFWEKRLKVLWSPKQLLAFFLCIAICSVWVVIVLRRLAPIEFSGQREFLSRAGAITSFRITEIFYYPAGIIAAFFPWSLLLPLGFMKFYYIGLNTKRKRLNRFLYCGILANIILFSLVAEKSVRYLLPIYPLMIVLVGLLLADLIRGSLPKRQERYIGVACTGLFGISTICIAGLIAAKTIFDFPQIPITIAFYAALAGVSIAGVVVSRKANYRAVVACVLLIFICAKVIFVFDYTPHRNKRHSVEGITEGILSQVHSGEVIYTVSFNKPRLFFYLHNPVVEVAEVSHVFEKIEDNKVAYCLLTEDELDLLENDYSDRWRLLYPFTYRDRKIAFVALGYGGRSEERDREISP